MGDKEGCTLSKCFFASLASANGVYAFTGEASNAYLVARRVVNLYAGWEE